MGTPENLIKNISHYSRQKKWLTRIPHNHRCVWANSDSQLKKSSCPKYNEHCCRILLKLSMQIILIWHSKDNTYTWDHINETLIFELGQLRHMKKQLCWPTHSVTHFRQWPHCATLRNCSGLGLTRRRERANKISCIKRCANSLGPIKYRINTRWPPKHAT